MAVKPHKAIHSQWPGKPLPSADLTGFLRKHAATSAANEMIAPQKNAALTPPAVAARAATPEVVRLAARDVKIATNKAVPAAPATCWVVPIIALPCE